MTIHYERTSSKGLYFVKLVGGMLARPKVIGMVVRICKDRWDAFSLNSAGLAMPECLGPRVSIQPRRYLAGEELLDKFL